MATNEIKIGTLATLVGPYADAGKDGMRGLDMAAAELGGEIAGKKLTVFKEGTNAMPDDAEDKADILMEQYKVDFMIAPLSGDEGLAMRDYAKQHLDKSFINGIAGAQDITLRNAAPNFFSFTGNGVQWMSGLAEYVYSVQGYKQVVTLAEDYSFPHGQVAGFSLQFCKIGGKITHRYWVPLGTSDYSEIVAAIPPQIDAIFVALGGTDAINFLKQYAATGRQTPLVGGTLSVDQTVLGTRGALSDRLVGMASCGPIADNNPAPSWQNFVNKYRTMFPKGLASPSLFAWGYYVNTLAALTALKNVDGDLSEGQSRFQSMLRILELQTPTGKVKLDHNRNAISNNFLTMVDKRVDGSLYNKLVRIVPSVNQTLGIPEDEYLKIGAFNRNNPPVCP
ncbi:MAG: ABC transporter substrate-binding protein [Anaerolineaceae bacterium]|nr:ABC transporter substrate-binding protein [Anaerolineaceae bacterium]